MDKMWTYHQELKPTYKFYEPFKNFSDYYGSGVGLVNGVLKYARFVVL